MSFIPIEAENDSLKSWPGVNWVGEGLEEHVHAELAPELASLVGRDCKRNPQKPASHAPPQPDCA